MKNCSRIERLIDEAERPEALSYEIDSHLAACAACNRFAGERARLRALIASTGRVTAPDNFDAMLRARIRERAARQAPAWLSAAGLLRWGMGATAAAALVVAAQLAGMFSAAPPAVLQTGGGTLNNQAAVTAPTLKPSQPPAPEVTPATVAQAPTIVQPIRAPRDVAPRRTRGGEVRRPVMAAPVLLVRGPNDEIEVPVPTVTMGAQPLVYSNVGRPAAGMMKTSF